MRSVNISFVNRAYTFNPVSASVENAEPTKVVLTFPDEKLLQAGDFTIAGFTINSAVWKGTILTLTLSTSVIQSDVLVLIFVNTGQTINVVNNITTSPVIPQLVSAEINNDDPGKIILTFDTDLSDPRPADSSFEIISNANILGVDVGQISGLTIFLYEADETSFAYGDIVTISYTQPLEKPLQGLDGGLVESFVDYPVTNNIEAP